jgi:hypothetical protein
MLKHTAALLLTCFIINIAYSQQATISGRIVDTLEKRNLPNAVISVIKKSDSTLVRFTRSKKDGSFILPKADTGKYLLLVTYPRFADYMDPVNLKSDLELGKISMTLKSKMLQEVVLRTAAAIRIKGDTTEFIADSFKVKQGATVEDLLKKLPGFTVNSKGEIVAQGKRVDKVLVDGEEFFGDDPTMATQNISAKAVDKVQVFDTKTEQQQLTGITTGDEGKTVNIRLKEDHKKGAFGKIYAGSDFEKFLDTKLLFNRFVGKKKFSIYGTKTNVSTGSLNWEDREKLGIENDFEYDELSGYYFSFGGNDEFNDWNLRGLPEAYTAGVLYSNKWNADRNNFNTSYRFNRLSTINNGSTLTQNILDTGISFSNNSSIRRGLNQVHVVNLKYEWKIDSLASIKLNTVNTRRQGDQDNFTSSEYLKENRDTVNNSTREQTGESLRYQSDNQLTYKQLFNKKNRQWQTVVRFGLTDDDNFSLVNSKIRYFKDALFDHSDTIDQQKMFDGSSRTLGVKSTFSEPMSPRLTFVADYAYNNNRSVTRNNTFEKDFNGKYEVLVNEFSNNFELDASSHSGNGLLRYTGKKITTAAGSGVSAVRLDLHHLDNNTFNRFNFLKITPQAQFVYTIKPQTNFRLNYRGTTRQPTINQLQPLKDNTDPLNVYLGNPDLKVGFNHNFSAGFNSNKTLSQRWIGINGSYNIQKNAITMFNIIDSTGKRTYYPVNVQGNRNWNFWGNLYKGSGEKKPRYGININGYGSTMHNYINGKLAETNSFSINGGINFGMEVPDKFSFWISPTGGYNYSKSSLTSSVNNNYFTYGGRFDGSVNLPWKIEIRTDFNADLRQKIEAFATNSNLIVWNAEISKKFFKDKSGKIGVYANDILNDNKGFTRTISSTFITDDRYERVSRYFLLKFEWSFNKMPGGDAK